jgi:SRSO17 transposase
MNFSIKVEHISNQKESLTKFHQNFSKFFQSRTRSVEQSALEYLKGLLIVETEKTMAQMERRLNEVCKQKLGHFISNSPWEDAPLIAEIQKTVIKELNPQGSEDVGLIIDESAIAKKGKKSVGVKRQYAGCLGKVDNCQVGVFLAYTTRTQTSLIARNLYLPEDWITDPERCYEAMIPLEKQVFKTKPELAFELVKEAIANKIHFSFVGMDAGYGGNPQLLDAFDESGITWFADVSKTQLIYTEMPKIAIEELEKDRVQMNVEAEVSCSIEELLQQKKIEFQRYKIRNTQRGMLVIDFAAIRVFINSKDNPMPRERWLLIRKEIDGTGMKFTLSNSPEDTSLEVLAERQSRRYWVERALEDAKSLAGLDQYRVTGWRGWHHHTTMVMLAMLYLLTIKAALGEHAENMTLKDALWIVEGIVPRKELTDEEKIAIILENHANRERSRRIRLEAQLKAMELEGIVVRDAF